MASEKIQEEKQEQATKPESKKKDEGKEYQKAIDETDIAIFKR